MAAKYRTNEGSAPEAAYRVPLRNGRDSVGYSQYRIPVFLNRTFSDYLIPFR